MEMRRLFLYCALAVVLAALWSNWSKEHMAAPTQQAVQQNASSPFHAKTNAQTNSVSAAASVLQQPKAQPIASKDVVHVLTNTMDVSISKLNGSIISAKLLNYKESVHGQQPISILNHDTSHPYFVQNGFVTNQGKILSATYRSLKQHYQLKQGQNDLTVTLKGRTKKGVAVEKTYTFERGKYVIGLKTTVANHSKQALLGGFYSQIVKRPAPNHSSHFFGLHTYEGAAISSNKKPYDKVSYSDLSDKNINKAINGGWLAMQQRYFLTALVPDQNQTYQYYSQKDNSQGDGTFTVGLDTQQINLSPGDSHHFSMKYYIGPEVASFLKPVVEHLDLTIDYGWLWPLSKAIFWVMAKINSFVGNWGWSIILITLLIKIAFYKLSETSYKSMANMRTLQPRIKVLQERFGDDKKKLSQATMEMYKKEKINPLGGCLPILIQIPVFIALYYVLIESVQLRQAPFIFWIHDLAAKDPFYILPVLMGISMFLMQRLTPAPPDKMQAKVMMFLPVLFTFIFLSFPAGLVLYWLVNNCVSVLQQWYIMRKVAKGSASKKKAT